MRGIYILMEYDFQVAQKLKTSVKIVVIKWFQVVEAIFCLRPTKHILEEQVTVIW